LLSIVNEKPSYAYEIDKILEQKGTRRWVKIGVASVYQVLKRLETKKMVYSISEKEGNMPDRKRYYITDTGKNSLIEASKRLISSFEWLYLDLNVGLEACTVLSIEEIASCLKKRLNKVKANLEKLKELYVSSNDSSFNKKLVLKNLIYFREAERNFIEDLLAQFKDVK